ncbi:MAG: hypothetical protein HY655_14865 [Acidobacteria bacterium]|nr:hypothetical protein [Acidobacteriota bacterium]
MTPVTTSDSARRRRRRRIWTLSGLLAALVAVLAMFAATVPFSADSLRRRIVLTLSDRLDSDVTLGELQFRLFPRMRVVGTDLVIRQRDRGNVPPLITIKRFEARADLAGLMRKHVAHVQLEGLDIEIPPNRHHDDDEKEKRPPESDFGDEVVIDVMDSGRARLAILSSKSHKPPKVWDIHTLHMKEVGVGKAMPYRATLTNAVPPGEIVTHGTFGPWQRDDPGDTPLDGAYAFDKADLSVFKGISGILSSRGSFDGTLDRIDAKGETDTPDFTIAVGGHPFGLHTKYHSIIDGTNGDTILERIDASFLQSSLVATGAVVDDTPDGRGSPASLRQGYGGPPKLQRRRKPEEGKSGRTVKLDIRMDRARVEDVMKMAVKTSEPPMSGGLKLDTRFLLPPGDADVVERLQLDGRFAIASARFTNYDVQRKIEELSTRGRGVKRDAPNDRVVSNFEGRFKLAGGTLHLPAVQFAVPGATVKLAGSYALKAEALDFSGQLLLDAKISQTVTGFKSVLLKVVDPFFKQKDGRGSALPIRIHGRRNAPQFGLDLKRALKKGR